jgi:hypothetical protein
MCINCNILTPLEDWLADKLGVERRKYLVVGHTTHNYIRHDDSITKSPYSLDIVNCATITSFELVGSTDKPTIVTEDGVRLYECKYRQIAPVRKDCVRNENAYRELFLGDIQLC